jgi:SAM-dependent methyltransferase
VTVDPSLDDRIVRAIHEHRLADEANVLAADREPSIRSVGIELLATLGRIADSIDGAGIESTLRNGGVAVGARPRPPLAQRHEVRFDVPRPQAALALEILADAGYLPHPHWRGGALRSFLATSDTIDVTRTDEWTTVVRLHLGGRSDRHRHLTRITTPRPADWAAVDLPTWAWRGYRIVRPVRLALERTGVRRRDHGAIEPFLATPLSLVEPLLDLAEVESDDVVADLGCGDGRIVVEAATSRGCSTIGVEYSDRLAASARRRAAEHGVADRVQIVTGDASAVDVAAVDVVMLFLPIHLAASMVVSLRSRLRPGSRIVCHEQNRPPSGFPTPDRTTALIGADAVTVAHLWAV